LHLVAGGSGTPILLLPGWPQSWYAWRYVMPLLVAAGRRVIALDPRGLGDSDRPASGYDMRTVAAEVHSAVEALGLTVDGPVDVLEHDLGTWIGYAYAAEWPDDVRRLAVFEGAVPGITPPPAAGIPSAEANVRTWHFAFNRLDDLPEILLEDASGSS
jgi:pimeloyl-ACP methyl ester carboxylesterase